MAVNGVRVVYPGTFDPVTRGHLDIAEKAAEIFGRLEVAVARDSGKRMAFSADERLALVTASLDEAGLSGRVSCTLFDGLLVDYMRRSGASVYVRGLRANSDFEYEFQMQLMNRKLAPEITGIYLMPSESNMYLSSTVVKELAAYGGCIDGLVTAAVGSALRRRFGAG